MYLENVVNQNIISMLALCTEIQIALSLLIHIYIYISYILVVYNTYICQVRIMSSIFPPRLPQRRLQRLLAVHPGCLATPSPSSLAPMRTSSVLRIIYGKSEKKWMITGGIYPYFRKSSYILYYIILYSILLLYYIIYIYIILYIYCYIYILLYIIIYIISYIYIYVFFRWDILNDQYRSIFKLSISTQNGGSTKSIKKLVISSTLYKLL